MLTCHDVGKYFLALTDEEAGDLISNLKLQKLVYYAQGYHLAIYGKPLFPEKIEAWTHGPVVPDLYHKYKKYDADPIPKPRNFSLKKYTKSICGLLDEIYKVFGQFSAWKLRNMTHSDKPWIDASPGASIITHKALKDHFKSRIK